MSDLTEANKVLANALDDESYFFSWQSNIAMSYIDEYSRSNKKYKNRNDLHEIANKAAINFLNMYKNQ